MKKKCIAIIILSLIITLLPQQAMADTREKTSIRVGYTSEDAFIKQENGIWSGYGVEYLEKIAEYTKWRYEYVMLDPDEIEEDLKADVVDLVFMSGDGMKSGKNILKSEFPMAFENLVIYTSTNHEYYYEDYEALDGGTIGILENEVDEDELFEFLMEKGISCKTESFDSHEELREALQSGRIDAVCHGSLHDCEDVRIISRFGINEYYCFTSGEKTQLMEQWNEAVEQIKYDAPAFEGELYEEYFGLHRLPENPMFTREEAEYIANAEPISVKLMLGSMPLSYLNSDGVPDGIFVDFFALLEKKSGLTFNIQIETDPTVMEALTEGLTDGDYIMFRAQHAIEASSSIDELVYSIPLVENHLTYIRRREDVADTGRMDYVFAVTKEMHYVEELLNGYSEDFSVIYYESSEKCLNAILHGDADIAIQDAYVMNYLLQKPIYKENLAECVGPEWTNGMCVVAGGNNAILIDIINKSIRQITKTERETIPTMEILLNPYQLSFMDIVYQYRDILSWIGVLLVITLLIYTILIRNLTKAQVEMKDYKSLQKKIQEDELTGLYNRPYFYRRSRAAINAAKEEMCIVLVNIINFQVVNDLYSMDMGDKLLKEIAGRLKQVGEEHDAIVGRFTGDRFYLCMTVSEFNSMSLPRQYTSELIDWDVKLNYGVYPVGEQKDIPISIMCERAAIAAHNKDANELEYIRYYSEDEHNQLLEEQQIESEMKGALESRQFCVYIQPKYDVEKGCIIGGEALVRWKHPTKGMIPPIKFIGIFEKTGFIVSLDYYVWEETCRYIADWKEKGIFKGPISVNVSRAHFYNRELRDKLLELVSKYQISPKDLQLEITETICTEDHKMIYGKIQELRECGFEIAMDDFGSGYSSLNMLKEMSLDVIKMDLKFLDGAGDDKKSKYILETIIRLAQNMDLEVVVEGVETEEQVRFLKGIGNVDAQGYFYSKPIESIEYEKLIMQ